MRRFVKFFANRNFTHFLFVGLSVANFQYSFSKSTKSQKSKAHTSNSGKSSTKITVQKAEMTQAGLESDPIEITLEGLNPGLPLISSMLEFYRSFDVNDIDRIVDDFYARKKGSCRVITENHTQLDEVPKNFLKGMAISFARSLCHRSAIPKEILDKNPAYIQHSTVRGILLAPPGRSGSRDLLKVTDDYKAGLSGNEGLENAARVYSLMAALVMQESDANIKEGMDLSKPKELQDDKVQEETGPYQVSPNSQYLLLENPHARIAYDELVNSYLYYVKALGNDPRQLEKICRTSKFTNGGKDNGKFKMSIQEVHSLLTKVNVILKDNSLKQNVLSNEDFVALNKSCPAFATEYAALVARVGIDHNGPFIRSEVKHSEGCDQMFQAVGNHLAKNPVLCAKVGLVDPEPAKGKYSIPPAAKLPKVAPEGASKKKSRR